MVQIPVKLFCLYMSTLIFYTILFQQKQIISEIGSGMLTTGLFETDNADTSTDTQIAYK